MCWKWQMPCVDLPRRSAARQPRSLSAAALTKVTRPSPSVAIIPSAMLSVMAARNCRECSISRSASFCSVMSWQVATSRTGVPCAVADRLCALADEADLAVGAHDAVLQLRIAVDEGVVDRLPEAGAIPGMDELRRASKVPFQSEGAIPWIVKISSAMNSTRPLARSHSQCPTRASRSASRNSDSLRASRSASRMRPMP